MRRHNYAPNPSFETDLSSLIAANTNITGASLTRSSAWASAGNYSARMTGTSTGGTSGSLLAWGEIVNITPGLWRGLVTFKIDDPPTSGGGTQLVVYFRDASNVTLGYAYASAGYESGVQSLEVLGEAPEGTTNAFIRPGALTQTNEALDISFDGLLIEPLEETLDDIRAGFTDDDVVFSDSFRGKVGYPAISDSDHHYAHYERGQASSRLSVIGDQLTHLAPQASDHFGYLVVGPFSEGLTRIGCRFVIQPATGTANDFPLAGGVVALNIMGEPDASYPTTFPNAPVQWEQSRDGRGFRLVESGSYISPPGGFTFMTAQLQDDGSTVYECAIMIDGDTAYTLDAQGTLAKFTDSRIASFPRTYAAFGVLGHDGVNDNILAHRSIYADTGPQPVPEFGAYADGDSDDWQWDGTPHASASREAVTPIAQSFYADHPTEAVKVAASSLIHV